MKSSNGGYGNDDDDDDDNWELWYFLKNLGVVAIAVVERPTVASLNVNFPTTNSLADSRQLHSSQLNWYRAVGVGKN